MQVFTYWSLLVFGLFLSGFGVTSTVVQADEVTISGINLTPADYLQARVPVTVTANAVVSAGQTIYYKFYYRANYGSGEYDASPWTVVQDYSTANSAEYTFPSDGHYIIAVRAVTDPENEPAALPIIGQAVIVGGDNHVNVVSMTADVTPSTNAGDTVNVSVEAVGPQDQTLYYQFYYCANYGTAIYGVTPWTLVQPYSTSSTCRYIFPSDGDYMVVVRVVTDPDNEPSALPIVGSAITIGDPSPCGSTSSFVATFGGLNEDSAASGQQTSDGGYIITGYTGSNEAGKNNLYLIKADKCGNQTWARSSDTGYDYGASVQQTSDGGYIIVGGSTTAWPYDWESHNIYLIKTNSSGSQAWIRTFSIPHEDCRPGSVQQTSDGGYIIAGTRSSHFSYTEYDNDVYLIKTDSNGNQAWTNTFRSTGFDYASAVQQTSDEGYIIVGCADTFGSSKGDVYLIKTDSSGNQIWVRTFGGTGYDYGASVQQTSDRGYIIAGTTENDNGKSGLYLIKTNSSGKQIWARTFSGKGWVTGSSVRQTADGGYVIAGNTGSDGTFNDDIYLLKTDGSGNQTWVRTFGGAGRDYCASVQLTSDGGYVIFASTDSYGTGSSDVYLIKTDSSGN